jgi:hypothetical protein
MNRKTIEINLEYTMVEKPTKSKKTLSEMYHEANHLMGDIVMRKGWPTLATAIATAASDTYFGTNLGYYATPTVGAADLIMSFGGEYWETLKEDSTMANAVLPILEEVISDELFYWGARGIMEVAKHTIGFTQ